jgi:hypothetical protein
MNTSPASYQILHDENENLKKKYDQSNIEKENFKENIELLS